MKLLKKKVLIIGSVWPEPNSSAAGSRMMQLIQMLVDAECKITFACTSGKTDHIANLEEFEIDQHQISINDSNFDSFLISSSPEIVLFDRFMIEEQFGWRVSKLLPDTLKILNTEDLHSLRKTREKCFKSGKEFTFATLLSEDITKREIASIYRCDLSLLISDYEICVLKDIFSISEAILFYLPLVYDTKIAEKINKTPKYRERKNFITIGNFRHTPNWESVLYLKEKIWPLIAEKLPDTALHIYGAYPPPKATQINNPKERFYIKGWAANAHKVMSDAKVCLAPLQFGAGIKGKLLEAMLCGTPSITTSIGAEGIHGTHSWNGFITNTPEDFAKKACLLYSEEGLWESKKKAGIKIIKDRFITTKFQNSFLDKIDQTLQNLKKNRTQNFIGSMLLHHSMRSTEYMSRWIELKNEPRKKD